MCSHCKKAKIIELEKKTTTCQSCNTKHHIKNLRIHYKTNSQEKARKVIGLLHAQQDGKKEEIISFI